MKNEDIRKKWVDTCVSQCGETHYMKSEKSKTNQINTNIKKYGVSNVMHIQDVIDKGRQTLYNKTGYYNISQTPEWGKLRNSRIEYDNIMFDSGWELNVYKYCKEKNISCIYHPSIIFEYTFNNKYYTYHPDFLIENVLYEVKGNQFFENHDPSKKMICPFGRTVENDNKAEAKHQCMIKNGIIILTESDIKNLDIVLKKR